MFQDKQKEFDDISLSPFDKIAEETKGKTVPEIGTQIHSDIVNTFRNHKAYSTDTQETIIRALIEEYPDIDVCAVLRPIADHNPQN